MDVLIIGAGVVGCSIARELSKFNLKIAVVEWSHDVSDGASKANSGIVHGGFDETNGTVKSKLCLKGNRMFDQLEKELNFGFKRVGSLVVARSLEEKKQLDHLLRNGRLNGVDRLYMLEQEEIRNLEPNIHPDIKYALYCPDAGLTSPYEYAIALAQNAATNGVSFFLGHQVVSIKKPTSGTGFTVNCSNHGKMVSFTSKIVINCAGLGSERVAAMVGAADFKIREYIILDKTQGSLAKTVIFPVPSATLGKGILVSPTYHGNLLLGPTSRELSENLSNEEILRQILKSATQSIPNFDPRTAITSYSGYRSKCSRKDFVIEESRVKGFINVAGIDSPGLTCSPAIALLVASYVMGICKRINIKVERNLEFNPYRKPIIISKPPTTTLQHSTETYICRCERVLETEIEDAVCRKEIPATTTDMVKKRTRAGMGVCQGSYCESLVVKILAKNMSIDPQHVKRKSRGSSVLPHRKITAEDRDLLDRLSRE